MSWLDKIFGRKKLPDADTDSTEDYGPLLVALMHYTRQALREAALKLDPNAEGIATDPYVVSTLGCEIAQQVQETLEIPDPLLPRLYSHVYILCLGAPQFTSPGMVKAIVPAYRDALDTLFDQAPTGKVELNPMGTRQTVGILAGNALAYDFLKQWKAGTKDPIPDSKVVELFAGNVVTGEVNRSIDTSVPIPLVHYRGSIKKHLEAGQPIQ